MFRPDRTSSGGSQTLFTMFFSRKLRYLNGSVVIRYVFIFYNKIKSLNIYYIMFFVNILA
jgi:hypothetical protein